MFETQLPYDHKTMTIKLEDKNFAGLLEGHQNEFKAAAAPAQLVEESLDHPMARPSSRSCAPASMTSSSSAPTTRAPCRRA